MIIEFIGRAAGELESHTLYKATFSDDVVLNLVYNMADGYSNRTTNLKKFFAAVEGGKVRVSTIVITVKPTL